MDGGTLSLIFDVNSEDSKEITLGQHMIVEYYEEYGGPPGRIYIDGQIVEKRSDLEQSIVEFIENDVLATMEARERQLLAEKLSFIKSDDYLNFVPIKMKMSEKRRKYLQLANTFRTYNLNSIERKFLDLKDDLIEISEFENWVYSSESEIIKTTSRSIYDDLIILNYGGKHSESEIAKILSIDFYKLELYQLCQHLEKLIYSENLKIEDIRHNKDNSIYDPYFRYYFDFSIKGTNIGMNNPFSLNSMNYDIGEEKRKNEFEQKFKNINVFFQLIAENLDSDQVRVVTSQELAEVDSNDYTIAYCGTKTDIVLNIDKHRLIVDKGLIKNKMKKYWL